MEKNQRSDEITDRDALQNARDAPGSEFKKRKQVQKRADQKNHRRAAQNFQIDVARHAFFDALAQSDGNRDADDKQKERENIIGRRDAVPVGVLERRVNRAPGS